MIKPSQAIVIEFETANPTTGAAADADSTPSGTLTVNGTDNAATVTVTKKATGSYKAAVTIPANVSAGDSVGLRINATVATVAGVKTVWSDFVDTKRLADLNDLAAGAAMTLSDNAITDAKIADNALTAAKFAAGAFAAVWNSLTSGMSTNGSVGKKLADWAVGNVVSVGGVTVTLADRVNANVDQISGDSTAADNCEAFFDGTGYAGTNNVIPTVTTLTNKTDFSLSAAGIAAIWNALTSGMSTAGSIGKRIVDYLTGDIFARLGLPAGASTAADIAAIKTVADAVKAKTDNLPAQPAAVGSAMTLAANQDVRNVTGSVTGNVGGSVASVTAPVTVGTNNDKSGYALSPAGVSAVQTGLATSDSQTALEGKIDTIDANVDAALADTNELQTDLANGGRLDLLIDAIKAKTDLGLVNTTWTDARAAKLDNLDAAVSSVGGGSGARAWTLTLTESGSGDPIAGASVWATTDEAGAHIVASGASDAYGQVAFRLDDGTVYSWKSLAGYNFANNPKAHTVDAEHTSDTDTGTAATAATTFTAQSVVDAARELTGDTVNTQADPYREADAIYFRRINDAVQLLAHTKPHVLLTAAGGEAEFVEVAALADVIPLGKRWREPLARFCAMRCRQGEDPAVRNLEAAELHRAIWEAALNE